MNKRRSKKSVSITGQPREVELREQIQRLSDELTDIVDAYENEQARPYVGKCYKYRGRSSDGKQWWIYYRVVSHNRGNSFKAFKFEAQGDGWHIVLPEEGLYLLPNPRERGLVEITAAQFQRAWNEYIDRLERRFVQAANA